jgi:hypothetical protein
VLLAAAAAPQAAPAPEPAPHYTNADLERLRGDPHRTGADSQPSTRPRQRVGPDRDDTAAEEARWRREARLLRERLLPLEDEIGELQERIRARRREPGVPPYSDPRIRTWEERMRRLEARKRERWARFRERARRARVPPGWIR